MKKNNTESTIQGKTKPSKTEKQEIDVSTSIKAIINGYVAYGIICLFIFIFLSIFINVIFSSSHTTLVSVSVSFFQGILVFLAMHGLCRLSTYDVFKKCKTKPENISTIAKKMLIFFLIIIICSIIISATSLFVKLDTLYKNIQLSSLQYSQVFSENFTNKLVDKMISDYTVERSYIIISTIILEFFFVSSVVSLMPYQKKILNTYNK